MAESDGLEQRQLPQSHAPKQNPPTPYPRTSRMSVGVDLSREHASECAHEWESYGGPFLHAHARSCMQLPFRPWRTPPVLCV